MASKEFNKFPTQRLLWKIIHSLALEMVTFKNGWRWREKMGGGFNDAIRMVVGVMVSIGCETRSRMRETG